MTINDVFRKHLIYYASVTTANAHQGPTLINQKGGLNNYPTTAAWRDRKKTVESILFLMTQNKPTLTLTKENSHENRRKF
jgi:hypothetical protein